MKIPKIVWRKLKGIFLNILYSIANYLEANTNIPQGASLKFAGAIIIAVIAIILLVIIVIRKIWHLIKYG